MSSNYGPIAAALIIGSVPVLVYLFRAFSKSGSTPAERKRDAEPKSAKIVPPALSAPPTKAAASEKSAPPPIPERLRVQIKYDGSTFELAVPRGETVAGLRRRVSGRIGVPEAELRLAAMCEQLDDGTRPLRDCGVVPGVTVHCFRSAATLDQVAALAESNREQGEQEGPAETKSAGELKSAGGADAGLAAAVEDKATVDSKAAAAKGNGVAPNTTDVAELKAKKRQEKLGHVRREIVEAEEVYLCNLSILMTRFQQPMRALFERRRWSMDDYSQMFNHLKPIVDLHKLLLSDLKKAYASQSSLADVFLRYLDFFRMYSAYLIGYNRAVDTLVRYKKRHKSVQELLESQRWEIPPGQAGGDKQRIFQDVMSYLIMPCQRIPRYELLLAQLKKYTPSEADPKHYRLICKAYARVKQAATHNNTMQRTSEDLHRLIELQDQVVGLPPSETIFSASRRLVREGRLAVAVEGTGAGPVECLVYLFSDMLLWTSTDNAFRGLARLDASSEFKRGLNDDAESSGFRVRANGIVGPDNGVAAADCKASGPERSRTPPPREANAPESTAWLLFLEPQGSGTKRSPASAGREGSWQDNMAKTVEALAEQASSRKRAESQRGMAAAGI